MRGQLTALLLLLLMLGACGEKRDGGSTPQTAAPARKTSRHHETAVPPAPPPPQTVRFRIRDIDRREASIEFVSDTVRFRKIRQPLVMVTLFADWCPPCRGMLPYLSRLQHRNRKDLFLIGVLVASDLNDTALRRFMLRHESDFFISNHPDNEALGSYLAKKYGAETDYPLPLTLIFKNGRYVMKISGAVPYEMLQNLVDQLKEKRSDTHVRISEKSPRKDQRSDPGGGPGEKKPALQGGAGGGTP